ncbi:MAG TPA: hypothetical protein VNV62_18630 [Trebonia sp.]|jgi:hypothetical protein|nr:hypothetical protein [Trebonia sp.]
MAVNLSKIEELFKGFIEAHPEVLGEAETAARDVAEAVAVPGPETFYDVIRAVVPLIPGLTDTARAEYQAAIDQHQAEHAALVTGLPAPVREGESA